MTDMTAEAAAGLSPLVLAYMGDAVCELLVRQRIVTHSRLQVNALHHAAVGYVKAGAQAAVIRAILPELSSQEQAVFRRGRNAHSHTSAKNASVIDYRMATGFEAVLGYLWLSGQRERAEELVERGREILDAKRRGARQAKDDKKVVEEPHTDERIESDNHWRVRGGK